MLLAQTQKNRLDLAKSCMHDHTRIIQARLPRLFMQLNIESDGINVECKTKIVLCGI